MQRSGRRPGGADAQLTARFAEWNGRQSGPVLATLVMSQFTFEFAYLPGDPAIGHHTLGGRRHRHEQKATILPSNKSPTE
jgi:hypothetical protein